METLYRKLSEFDLSIRTKNSLKKAGIDTLQELITYTKPELIYFGKRVLMELEELVHCNNLNFSTKHIPKSSNFSQLEKLEADKIELLEALESVKPALRYFHEKLNEIESLIQKHKQCDIK